MTVIKKAISEVYEGMIIHKMGEFEQIEFDKPTENYLDKLFFETPEGRMMPLSQLKYYKRIY